MKKVFITGGHPTPAFALTEELKNENVKIFLIGRKHHLEGSKSLSPEYTNLSQNVKFLEITTGRLQRYFTVHTIPSLLKIPFGLLQSIFYILKYRPSIVVSFGSYVSTPVIFAAWLVGIPSITHEQTTKVGLANKINSLFVRDFFSTWPLEETGQSKTIGNLTRSSINHKNAASPTIGKFLKSSSKILYITGGSIGSHAINLLIFNSINKFKDYKIIHQIGTANYQDDHKKAQSIKNNNYLSLPYVNEKDIGAVLNAAHIVISRSGANTIWEIAVLKKPSILIPLPIAGSKEQYYNAQVLEKAGCAIVIPQKDLTEDSLLKAVKQIDNNYSVFTKNAQLLAKDLNLNASKIIKQEILKYLND